MSIQIATITENRQVVCVLSDPDSQELEALVISKLAELNARQNRENLFVEIRVCYGEEPMPTPTYTTDPELVTSVVWYIASEFVCDYRQSTGAYVDGPDDEERMQVALDHLGETVTREYPNCADIYIASGGFENQFANMSPRCETSDDSIYEPFYDDMTRWEEQALSHACDSACSLGNMRKPQYRLTA